jgi:hypothetical protein
VKLGMDDLLSPSGAEFSKCELYRYVLWRNWEAGPRMAFVGLNPSTADHEKNDPTVLRCIQRAKSLHCGGMFMLNIFAWRDTDPRKMKKSPEPIGKLNDQWIMDVCQRLADVVVCCWGTHGAHLGRGKAVKTMLKSAGLQLRCLGVTKGGHPGHPLYVEYARSLREF